MPQGAASPLGDEDWKVVEEHFDNAAEHGMESEWLRWFVGGIVNQRMSPRDAAAEATIEWDL